MAQYAYIRVSTIEQTFDRQIDSIKVHFPGINSDFMFCDKQSGKNFNREQYVSLKAKLKKGDELIIHELDRFGRDKDMIKKELLFLKEIGVLIRVLNIPTTLISLPEGQSWVFDMVNNILIEVYSSFAEEERKKTSIRTKEGLAAARRRGRVGGRPPVPQERVNMALRMYKTEEFSVDEIANECGISRSCLYKYISQLHWSETKNSTP